MYADFPTGSFVTQKTKLLLLGGWLAVLAKTARLLIEYDANHSLKRKDTDHHHEQIPIVQKTFIVDVKNMRSLVTHLLIPVLIFLHLILNKQDYISPGAPAPN